ncbi:MAG: hypothetical protein AB7P02_25230, partial [Alphaproteobacteria bacterium]
HLAGDTISGFHLSEDSKSPKNDADADADVIAITGLNPATQGKYLDSLVITGGVLSLSKVGGGQIVFEGLADGHYTDTVLGSDGSILLYIV